ncbi:hypothetical protein [Stenotrophomonas sp. SrG]
MADTPACAATSSMVIALPLRRTTFWLFFKEAFPLLRCMMTTV